MKEITHIKKKQYLEFKHAVDVNKCPKLIDLPVFLNHVIFKEHLDYGTGGSSEHVSHV